MRPNETDTKALFIFYTWSGDQLFRCCLHHEKRSGNLPDFQRSLCLKPPVPICQLWHDNLFCKPAVYSDPGSTFEKEFSACAVSSGSSQCAVQRADRCEHDAAVFFPAGGVRAQNRKPSGRMRHTGCRNQH